MLQIRFVLLHLLNRSLLNPLQNPGQTTYASSMLLDFGPPNAGLPFPDFSFLKSGKRSDILTLGCLEKKLDVDIGTRDSRLVIGSEHSAPL